jgi:hypothetical protein
MIVTYSCQYASNSSGIKFITHQVYSASSSSHTASRTQTASYPIPSQSASPQSATDNKSQSRLAFGGRQPIFTNV